MKVSSLLKVANACTTEEGAKALLDALRTAFCACKAMEPLQYANAEAYLESGKPFVRFELNRVISNEYITMIRPEIRDGELTVCVVTNRMLDGQGMGSQRWEAIDGMDDLIEASPVQTIKFVADLAKSWAVMHHKALLEGVGVPSKLSGTVAKKSW